MAPVFVSSSLSIAEQAERLQAFVGRHNRALSTEAAEHIARALHLSKRAQAQTLARRLRTALLAHGIAISYQAALEALAKICKHTSWMRMRQRSLPFECASGAQRAYCMQLLQAGQEQSPFTMERTLDAITTRLLEIVRASWGHEVTPALCTLNIGPQAIAIDFEHPTKAWFSVQIWLVSVSGEAASMLSFPHEEVRWFVDRVQSALEHTHPGLWVLGAVRSDTLPPWYYFRPTFRQAATGIDYLCSSELEIFTAFDVLQIDWKSDTFGESVLQGKDGAISLTSAWASAMDGAECLAPIKDSQLRSIVQRTVRLRGITGRSLLHFFVYMSTGYDAGTDCHQFDRDLLEEKRTQLGLTIGEVAARAGVSINTALRLQKYGWAHVSVLPKLAAALNIEDPNELAGVGEGVGMRVTRGDQFVQALQDTCYWRIILGESLESGEQDSVAAIAENLREYIDLLQFSRSPIFNENHSQMEPLDPAALAEEIQKLLDQLSAMGVGVIVGREVYFASTPGQVGESDALALPASALLLKKVSRLRRPAATWTRAAA